MSFFMKLIGLGGKAKLSAGKYRQPTVNVTLEGIDGNLVPANLMVTFSIKRKKVKVARRYFEDVDHLRGTADYIIRRAAKQWAVSRNNVAINNADYADMRKIHGPIAQDMRRYGILVDTVVLETETKVQRICGIELARSYPSEPLYDRDPI